ncbi:unnamed protein product [Auanema sp. JU1783]|nr:unnamed protein product [Auanema sp. JU1783]
MSFAMYKIVLVISICLIVAGILLTAFSIFSPLWQVAEIPSLYVSHHHGLWWDCIVSYESNEKIIPLRDIETDNDGDKCISKFDPSSQNILRTALERGDIASRELLLHRFLPQHKAVIFFSVFTFLFGIIGIIIGACSPCFPPNSLLYVVAIFMTCSCSVLADIIFAFAATKDDMSIEEKALDQGGIGPFKHRLGFASYVHMFSSCIFATALVFSILSSYLLITSNKGQDSCCNSRRDYLESGSWRSSNGHHRSYDQKVRRPFVVVDDDDSL